MSGLVNVDGASTADGPVVVHITPKPFVPGLTMADDDRRASRDALALFSALRKSLPGTTFAELRELFRTAPGYGQERT